MLHFVVALSSLAILTAAQTCSNSGNGPCVNGICQTGNTCITSSNICCTNANIVSACTDLLNPKTGLSDCPGMASYCNNSAYYTLMTQQCPKTCGRCSTVATTASSTCVDQVNPSTGASDCTKMASYCNNSAYYALMTQQCPKTCGRCSG